MLRRNIRVWYKGHQGCLLVTPGGLVWVFPGLGEFRNLAEVREALHG